MSSPAGWMLAALVAVMARKAGGDSSQTCTAQYYTSDGIICPSPPEYPTAYSVYKISSIAKRIIVYNDNVALTAASFSPEVGNGCQGACSDYGFSGITTYTDVSQRIVGLTFYSNYPDATPESRWWFSWTYGTSSNTVVDTFFCPSGSLIIGSLTVQNNDQPNKHRIKWPVICQPLFCPAGRYPSTDAMTCNDCPIGKYTVGADAANIQNFMTKCDSCTNGAAYGNPLSVMYITSGTSATSCQFLCFNGYGLSNSQGSSQQCGECNHGYYSNRFYNDQCEPCARGSYTNVRGSTVCNLCTLGDTYQEKQAQTLCERCTIIFKSEGHYWTRCLYDSNSQIKPCPACNAGFYLYPPCGTTYTYTPPTCTACPAGKYQKNAIISGDVQSSKYNCIDCGAGKYQNLQGQAGCNDCKNLAPVNGKYSSWVTISAVYPDSCPVECNVGYGWDGFTCQLCPKGKYTAGGIPRTNCLPCSYILDTNAYWLEPVNFNRGYDACPWDCNAGFYKILTTNVCAACIYPMYSSVGDLRLYENMTVNQCKNCVECVTGKYEVSPCQTTSNRQCGDCITQCNPGYYMTACTSTSNSRCISCGTCTPGRYILSDCSGQVKIYISSSFFMPYLFFFSRNTQIH